MSRGHLGLLLWNPHVSNPWANVRATLNAEVKRDRPGIIVLNEVKKHWGEEDDGDGRDLVDWGGRNGYVCFQERPLREVAGKPVPEHGSTAVLVDSELDILSARVVTLSKPWLVFSHKRWHAPRRGWQIRVRDDSGRWKGRFVHGPTNGFAGGNRVAFGEFTALMRDSLVNKGAGTVSFAVSDHNERLKPLRKWARLFGAKVAGHGVDSCVAVGAAVTAETGGKHGSDHHLIRFNLRRK